MEKGLATGRVPRSHGHSCLGRLKQPAQGTKFNWFGQMVIEARRKRALAIVGRAPSRQGNQHRVRLRRPSLALDALGNTGERHEPDQLDPFSIGRRNVSRSVLPITLRMPDCCLY